MGADSNPKLSAFDVVIVGGGPAGLNAALVLGRSLRRVLLCDAGRPRNRFSHELHGFLSRDGIPPAELLRIGRDQLRRYHTIESCNAEVTHAVQQHDGFEVTLAGGTAVRCRKLLIATGVVDCLPAIRGFEEIYGTSAFHCPYCDGWEFREQSVAIYGPGRNGFGLALELTGWSSCVTLCSDGPSELRAGERAQLVRLSIALREERVDAFQARQGMIERVTFHSGPAVECGALFFNVDELQASPLARLLGCAVTEAGAIDGREDQATTTPGLYVAGDAGRGSQLAIIAAAEGARAAIAINSALLVEDRERISPPQTKDG
ncbi:MAG: NAD(P)/FAD-dependent oxidoreductase [Candidatus Eisenbacteria bacterium]